MKSSALLGVAICVLAYGLVESGIIDARLKLSFNSVMDKVVSTIHSNATAMGLKPYNVQDINETFKFDLINAGLYLDNGKIYGIDTIFRSGNTTADLNGAQATVTVALAFQDLTYQFDFAAKVGNLGPRGKLHGAITELYVDAVVLANMKNTSDITVAILKLKLNDKGSITVRVDSKDQIADALVDAIAGVVTKLFKNVIFDVMEKELGKVANSTLSKMHFDINSLGGL